MASVAAESFAVVPNCLIGVERRSPLSSSPSSAALCRPLPLSSSRSRAAGRRGGVLLVRAEADEAPPTPRTTRKFTGYVQKDTAGQENIYAVEPTVYVGDSAFSNSAGRGGAPSASGPPPVVAGLLGLAAVAGAAAVFFTLGGGPASAPADEAYSGPPLMYYIQKFEDPSAIRGQEEAFNAGPVSAPTATSERAD